MTNPPYTRDTDLPLSHIPFTPRAEASILELSKWMRISGIIGIVASILKLCFGIFLHGSGLGGPIGAVVTFLVGYWSIQAASSFEAVARTDSEDQRHLMNGFGLLRRVFLLQAVMVILAFALMTLVIVGGIIYAMAKHST